MSNANPAAGRWAQWTEAPARYVHPASLAHCFGDALGMDVIVQMQANARIQADLKALIKCKHDLAALPDAPVLEGKEMMLALMSSDAFTSFGRTCGAIIWADVIAAEIRASAIVEIKQRIGELAYTSALKNRDLSSDAERASCDIEALTEGIERDGATCLASWIGGLPSSIQGWMRLKLAPFQTNVSPRGEVTEARMREVVNRVLVTAPYAKDGI
ncbi:hypothetical protein IB262_33205 [Ensifer sp. ENS02]|uniref:hypothetical protein n=1 Tax=Ensifer sp. ENS02 TaxID=2769290 RepID=UPI00178653A1|nr:hypothetical protein [Ensifer sp. ENS02]MBD9524736.1 hypothetical protein [Ensifer sp. ENS02]